MRYLITIYIEAPSPPDPADILRALRSAGYLTQCEFDIGQDWEADADENDPIYQDPRDLDSPGLN